MKRLDTLQLKGLRKNLNMDTTYGNMQKGTARTNKNEKVFTRAQMAVKEEVEDKYQSKVRKRRAPLLSTPPTALELDRMDQWQRRIKAEHFKHQRQLKVYKLSTYYKQRKLITLGQMIRGNQEDPTISATLDNDTLRAIDHGKKRVGRPRAK